MPSNPFVVGQWVRGERFYGRDALIEEILEGQRNWLWLLGTRRIGKTSLLKQVEHITAGSAKSRYFPVFWDLQGADSPEELHLGFSDALLDAEERLDELGVAISDVESDDLFASLSRLRRKLRAKRRRLLLLCDEVEELITLNEQDPSLLRKLRRAMQSKEDIRSVLASTIRLWALAEQQQGDTSPFLHGFSPPLYIHTLVDDEANALIRQAHLPTASRPRFDERTAEVIRGHCDNHPYLIQLLCKRYQELGNLDEAIEQVATDPMVSYFFSVDFKMLSDTEHNILRVIARSDASSSNSIQGELGVHADHMAGVLHRLEHLGYLRRNEERRYVLANYFFRRWFRDRPRSGNASMDSQLPITSMPSKQTTISDGVALGTFDGRYELSERLGTGASGVVYKAYDTTVRETIAIKLLRREYSENPEALERFRQEMLLARDLGHPHILRIYHFGAFGDRKYVTMKWVGGPTLSRTIREQGAMPLGRTLELSIKLASALEAAHAAGVIHRDIKPHNVLLDENGEPYLTDFGLARLQDRPGFSRSGMFLGTPDYASPEQARLQPLDARADLYSLGLVIFEMATGRRPFRAGSIGEILEMHRSMPPPDPRTLRDGIPEGLAETILRCLRKDPEERFQTARELVAALEAEATTKS